MILLKTARTFRNLLDYSLRGDVNAQYLVLYTFDVQHIFDFLCQKKPLVGKISFLFNYMWG